jgi:hypothetical protein
VAPLVALTSVHGSFTAHVLAARLNSEGIDVELRGALGAAYGLTVGDMARVDLYVPAEQMDDARLVLLASEVDAAMEPAMDGEADPAGPGGGSLPVRVVVWPWVVAVILLVAAVVAPLLRIIAD